MAGLQHVVWVYCGDTLPAYFGAAQRYHERYAGSTVFHAVCRKPEEFKSWSTLPEMRTFGFYDGPKSFWGLTAFRLFALADVMEELHLSSCIHLECDVVLYEDPAMIGKAFSDAYGSGVAVGALGPACSTAGIMYVGSFDRYKHFTHGLRMLMRQGGGAVLKRVGPDLAANEMHLLQLMTRDYPDMVSLLPSLPGETQPYAVKQLPWLFDAGGLGQTLGGVGPFSHHYTGQAILDKKMSIHWDAALRKPFVLDAKGQRYPLANLHIHNKHTENYT